MKEKRSSGAKLTWVAKPASTRGPKPSLSPDQIARTAVRVADAEDLAAVTMQRLAREVGLTTMALYRYVSGKADVVAMMIDSAVDPPLYIDKPALPWDTRLADWARRCLAIYQSHSWFLEATTTRQSLMGPNELSWMEAALAMLAEAGLDRKDRHRGFFAIIGHVRGHATFHQIRRASTSGKARTQKLAQILRSEANRYPILLNLLDSGAFSQDIGGAFDFGLDCILDGIRARANRGRRSRI